MKLYKLMIKAYTKMKNMDLNFLVYGIETKTLNWLLLMF